MPAAVVVANSRLRPSEALSFAVTPVAADTALIAAFAPSGLPSTARKDTVATPFGPVMSKDQFCGRRSATISKVKPPAAGS